MKRIREFGVAFLFTIICTIIYEKLIDPNWNNALYFIAKFLTSISTSYLDFLYNNIGDGLKEIFSYYVYVLFYASIIAIAFIVSVLTILSLFLKRSDENKYKKEEEKKKEKEEGISIHELGLVFKILIAAGVLFIFGYVSSQSIKHHYTYNAVIYIEKSLDIIAPVVSEQHRLELRADYRRIDSYQKFKAFNDKLKVIAKQNNLELPEFKIVMQ